MKAKEHNFTIDLMRGCAAIAVGFYHLAASNGYLASENWLRHIASHGHLGVQVFFMISGFVIPLSMYNISYTIADFKKFIVKRIVRIEPPYLVMVIISPLLWYLSSLLSSYRGKPFNVDVFQVLTHLGYLTEFFSYEWLNPVFWTLAIEFQFYLLIALVFNCFLKPGVSLLVIVLFTIIGSFDLGHHILFSHILFFDLGILIFLTQKQLIKKEWFLSISALTFFIITLKYDLLVTEIALISFLLIFLTNLKTKLGSFLGMISYSFYLIHVPVGVRVVNFCSRFVHDENLKIVVIFTGIVVSIIAAYLFYRLVEEPALKFSRKIRISPKGLKAADAS